MSIQVIDNERAVAFLENNFSSPTHWPDWNELVSKYNDTKFYYLGYFCNKRLIGIFPFHEIKHKAFLKRRQSGQFHFIPNGGWIFSKPINVNEKFFASNFTVSSQVFTLPILKEFNAIYAKTALTKATLVIDLEKAEEEIWKDEIDSKRRNMIRKAEKEGVKIIEMTTVDQLEEFYKLYAESAAKFASKLMGFQFFKEMFVNSKNISLNIYAAFLGDDQLANVAIVSDKNYSIYWLGNNASNAQNLGQGDALQWHVIKEMINRGCRYYDLCYIEPERLPSIYRFKKGFSNVEIPIEVYSEKTTLFKIFNRLL